MDETHDRDDYSLVCAVVLHQDQRNYPVVCPEKCQCRCVLP